MTANLLDRDDLLSLTEAAKRLPGRPHRTTLWRWHRQGIELPDGGRVYLSVTRLGKRTFVAPEDLQAFSSAIDKAERQAYSPPPSREVARSSRAARAEAEADELGL